MQLLKNSGLPIYLEKESNKLAFTAPLQLGSYGEKIVGQMLGLLAKEENLELSTKFYDVYRAIRYPDDEERLKRNRYQYDITYVMDGLVNGECKKTSGHYHGFNPQRTNTYPEVYEVIEGTALYVLQRAKNFESDPEGIIIEDVILTVVKAGQTIIIPPNYGHCSINIGDGPMIFSNLAYIPCPVIYDSVRYYHGMSYYVFKTDGEVKAELNQRYSNVPEPKFAVVKENERLGIKFGLPIYQSYQQNPGAFEFLGNPDAYVDEIMSMLEYKENLKDAIIG